MSESYNDFTCLQIDRQKAIRNLGGMTWLYEKHVSRFCSEYSGAAADISSLLASGRKDEARRLAHSIKGLAGTLGFSGLQHAAAHIESDIIKNGCISDCALIAFTLQLNHVIEYTLKE